MSISNVITLLGGVAMFLFGMSLMGDGLKKVAGNKLELFLYKLSSTPLKGILLGTGVTAVIQSSSATSVMVVGFVNSGMMKVGQAIGIIMGAIIGTSVTGWVISLSYIGEGTSGWLKLLSTETLAALCGLIGILIMNISKKKSAKHVGTILLGFAVLMMGMQSMSGSVSGLRTSPVFISFLTGFTNPLLGILFGLVFTTILQSASAAVGIVQALSTTGVISFEIAFPIIMGIAIGASVPVLLSAVGSSVAGRRTALSYLIVDTMGVIIVSIVFYAVNAFAHFGFMGNILDVVSIAALNSVFRIVIVLVLSPFIGLIEKIVCKIIREDPRDAADMKDINRLEERFLPYPPLAAEQCRLSVNSMAEKTKTDIFLAIDLLGKFEPAAFAEAERLEELIDRYEDKLGNYLAKLTSQEMSSSIAKDVNRYLHTITDLERISDHALNISESAQEISEKKLEFTPDGLREIKVLLSALEEIVEITVVSLTDNDIQLAYHVEPLEELIDRLTELMKNHHIERLQHGECTLGRGYIFNDLLINIERVSDHCSNIALAIIETGSEDMEAHEYSVSLKEKNYHHFEEYYKEYSEKYAI